MNSDGTNIRPLVDSFDVRGTTAWSPDGKWIAVTGNAGDGMRVFKVPVEGGGAPIRLVNELSFHPIWSRSGDVILYAESVAGGAFRVKAITPDGAPVTIPETLQAGFAVATPYRMVTGKNEIITLADNQFFWYDLTSGASRQLTDLTANFKLAGQIRSFDVTPDGKRIVFARQQDNADIVLISLKE